MFGITKDPSSGSLVQYLAKITKVVPSLFGIRVHH